MNYKKFGNMGLLVSEIFLGTMTFRTEFNKKESIKMFNILKDKGINLIQPSHLQL